MHLHVQYVHARDTIISLPDDKMASAETLNWLELLLKHIYSNVVDIFS
jgi:hypothetical protein